MLARSHKPWRRWVPSALSGDGQDDCPIIPMSELVTDFEIVVPGVSHTIGITRSPCMPGHWQLMYCFYAWNGEFIKATLDLSRFDNATLRTKHEQIVKRLRAQTMVDHEETKVASSRHTL